jgi:hypothetical protein
MGSERKSLLDKKSDLTPMSVRSILIGVRSLFFSAKDIHGYKVPINTLKIFSECFRMLWNISTGDKMMKPSIHQGTL